MSYSYLNENRNPDRDSLDHSEDWLDIPEDTENDKMLKRFNKHWSPGLNQPFEKVVQQGGDIFFISRNHSPWDCCPLGRGKLYSARSLADCLDILKVPF